jgi:hypothetical protein
VTIKFNFYDIYGFALPGFLLLAVLWLPFGLIENRWPDAEFSSALVGVIFAYFAGHLLQTIAHHALPSSLPNGRHPSSVFLDTKDVTFTSEFKERLAEQIYKAFGLNVSLDLSTDATDEVRKNVDRVRNDAFFLCRSALIKSKTVFYAEQFEGLYALMRGLSAAFAVAVAYYLGWANSGLFQFIKTFLGILPATSSWTWSGFVILVGIIVAIGASARLKRNPRDKKAKNVMVVFLLLAAYATGYYLGLSRLGASEHRGQLIAAAVFSFFASERCHAGYKAFAQEFAKAVYRDFSNYEKPATGHEANSNTEAAP